MAHADADEHDGKRRAVADPLRRGRGEADVVCLLRQIAGDGDGEPFDSAAERDEQNEQHAR